MRRALEFVPYTTVRSLAEAREGLRAGGSGPLRPAGRHWHLVRSGGPPADPAGLGAHEIACVQLADAAPGSADDLADESRRCRLLPGEGVVDFHAVAAALADAGYDGPLGPEVLSAGSDARSPEDVAEACFCSVQAFFPA